MLDRSYKKDPYTLVMLTLDAHSIGSVERIKSRFSKIYPELEIIVHAAASWEEDPSSLLKTKEDLAKANMVLITLVFLEDHISAILPDLKKARENCDLAWAGLIKRNCEPHKNGRFRYVQTLLRGAKVFEKT